MGKKKKAGKATSTAPSTLSTSTATSLGKGILDAEYFQNPHWLRTWHNRLMQGRWLRGLILAVILAALALGTMALGERLFAPPAIAKYLPADTTVAYAEFNLEAYNRAMQAAPETFPWNLADLNEHMLTTLTPFGTELHELPDWLGDRVGFAWIQNEKGGVETWVFAEGKEALISALPEGKSIPHAYAGKYIVMGPAEESVFWKVKSGEHPSLKDEKNFRVLRPALSYQAPAFFYMNPKLALEEGWLEEWTDLPTWQNDLLQTVLPVFPAMGLTVQAGNDPGAVELETYWVGDKSIKGGKAFFHLDQKYRGTLLKRLPACCVTSFTGGEQLATTLDQGMSLLNALNGTGILYKTLLEQKLQSYDLWPLLDEEYLVAWVETSAGEETPASAEPLPPASPPTFPVLLLQLPDQNLSHLEGLIDTLLNRGFIEMNETTGTITAASLTLEVREESGVKVNVLTRDNGGEFLQYLIQDKVLIVTRRSEEMKTMIRVSQEVASVENAVNFGDHVRFSPMDGRLGIDQLFSSINLFDDGIGTWHEILFE